MPSAAELRAVASPSSPRHLAIEIERPAQRSLGLIEFILGRQRPAEDPQGCGPSLRGDASFFRRRPLGQPLRLRRLPAGKCDAGAAKQNRGYHRIVGLRRRIAGRDQQRLGVEIALQIDVKRGERRHRLGCRRRAGAARMDRDFERLPPQCERRVEIDVF